MIKITYICDKCKKQKTSKDTDFNIYIKLRNTLPNGWLEDYGSGEKHYCSKKCKPRRPKTKYVNPNEDSDPGVGSLYGRT